MFQNLNKLPIFKETQTSNSSADFINEDVNIKELDYFYSNSISRSSKTMSECRQIKNFQKKMEPIIYDRIFSNFRTRNL